VDVAALEHAFDTNRDRFLRDWMELLRFPSLGGFPEREGDCERCAAWLRDWLSAAGLPAEVLSTPHRPVVFAERGGRPDAPTVLFYGHYDVQPADPLEQWTTPPFDPHLRAGRMYARGAEDNKGQLFAVLAAAATLVRNNALPGALKIVLEGEEECGSRGLYAKLAEWKRRLAADVLMVADTGTVPSGAPTITMGLRGVAFLNARLRGPDHDLHSGTHGGLAPNPALGMARLLTTLHRPDGSVAVAGYYDGVAPPADEERRLADAEPFDPAEYRRATGCDPAGGERGLSAALRRGFRPTLEINGLHSGYAGPGTKTIIPSEAEAKISLRLVAGQDPAHCLEAVARHLAAHVPPGLRLDIPERAVGGPGFRLRLDSRAVARARRALAGVSPQPTAFLWEGASVPVVSALAEAAGAEPILVGFGSEEDRIHAPDESFSVEQFRKLFLYAARFLSHP
jgi:acetylornithine deacetylase/succinyl-diaminopimelate desuccinylase-like protein